MRFSSLLLYVGLTGLGVLAVLLTVRLYTRYRTRYLQSLLLATVFYTAFNFLDIIANYMAVGILNCKLSADSTTQTVRLIFGLLALPFLFVSWYFMIRMILDMANRVFKLWAQILFVLFQLSAFFFFLTTINRYFTSDDLTAKGSSNDIVFYMTLLNYLVIIGLFVWASLSKNSFSNGLRQGFQIFSGLNVGVIVLFYSAVHLILTADVLCYGYPILAFSLPLIPILYLRKFLVHYYQAHKGFEFSADKLQQFYKSYKISEREKEIIDLVLQGQSNRDIGETLYISIKTVKTHIYNIYRKLNIKSRYQLINLIQNAETG